MVYDKGLKLTPEWGSLYSKWKKLKKCSLSHEFQRFQDFYHWSMENDFEPYAKLVLIDESKPYSPDNCQWIPPVNHQEYNTEEQKLWIKKWNKTVNVIRRHYGMKPLPENGDRL